VVLKPDNGPELPVQVQDHAVLEIVRRRHAWPPFLLLSCSRIAGSGPV
jgi:hypothetical protein